METTTTTATEVIFSHAASRVLAIPELLTLIASFSSQRSVFRLRRVSRSFRSACAPHFRISLPIAFSPDQSSLTRSQIERVHLAGPSIDSLTLTPSNSRHFGLFATTLAPSKLGIVLPYPSTPEVYDSLMFLADGEPSEFARRLGHLTVFVLGVDWEERFGLRFMPAAKQADWDDFLNHGSLLGYEFGATTCHHPLTTLMARLPSLTIVGYSGTKQDRQIGWSTLGRILRDDCPRLKSLTLTGLVLADIGLETFAPIPSSAPETTLSGEPWSFASLTSLSLSRTRLSIESICQLSRHLPNLHTIEVRLIGSGRPLSPFGELPEPPAGLSPLKFKKVTVPYIETIGLVLLLPLLEQCTDLRLNHVQVATYRSHFILQAFEKIEKRNHFRHFSIGISSIFSYEMMTLLRLECFESLESLTIKGPIEWLLSALKDGVVGNYRNERRPPAAFWKTLRRVSLKPLSWLSLSSRETPKLFAALRRMPRLESLYLNHAMKTLNGILSPDESSSSPGTQEVEGGGGGCPRLRELRILFDCDPMITPESIQTVILDQLAPNLEFLTLAILEEDEKVGVTMREWSKTMNERRGREREQGWRRGIGGGPGRGGDDGVVVRVVEAYPFSVFSEMDSEEDP